MKEIEVYLNSLKLGNKSDATIRVYSKDLAKFVDYFKFETFDDIKKLTVIDYQTFYGSFSNLKETSLNGLIRTLSAFFKWSDFVSDNAFFKVKFGNARYLKEPQQADTVFTDNEIENLIKSAGNIQTKFMITLMAFNGLRRDEVRRIKLTDIGDCSVLIKGKGNKKFIVSLHETVCTMLNIYMSQRDTDSEYLFYSRRGETGEDGMLSGVSINNRIKSALRKANFSEEQVKKFHAHSIRHFFATRMIKEFGLDVAQRAMRHSNPTTTKRYDHSGNYLSNNALLTQKGLNVLETNGE